MRLTTDLKLGSGHGLLPMSDVRSLLKAKRQEVRVNHPLAAYSEETGRLRCIICSTIIKHPSAFDGHLGSKQHRLNVTRLKEEERLKETQLEEHTKRKRKAEQESDAKRRRVEDDAEVNIGAPKAADIGGGFPSDFFSDPSRAPLLPQSDDEEEEDGEAVGSKAGNLSQPSTAIDLEWEKFQQAVLNPPDDREKYERATIFAEPELASEIPEGFPPKQADETPVETPKDEEQIRRQKEQDERELIMDRLLDEGRAQEEADMRVTVMKRRLDALKKKREAAKASRAAK